MLLIKLAHWIIPEEPRCTLSVSLLQRNNDNGLGMPHGAAVGHMAVSKIMGCVCSFLAGSGRVPAKKEGLGAQMTMELVLFP